MDQSLSPPPPQAPPPEDLLLEDSPQDQSLDAPEPQEAQPPPEPEPASAVGPKTETELAEDIKRQAAAEADKPEDLEVDDVAAEEPAEVEAKAEPVEEAPVPEFGSWEDIAKVSETLSPRERALVERVAALAKPREDAYSAGLKLLGQKQEKFEQVLAELESHGFDGSKVLGGRLQEEMEARTILQTENAAIAWRAFVRLHPEINSATKEFQDAFSEDMEKVNTLFKGETLLDRLEQAYDWTAYRTKTKPEAQKAAPAPAQAQPEKPKGATPPPPKVRTVPVAEGRKQAALSDGRNAFSISSRSVDEMSKDEILSRHERLLED